MLMEHISKKATEVKLEERSWTTKELCSLGLGSEEGGVLGCLEVGGGGHEMSREEEV